MAGQAPTQAQLNQRARQQAPATRPRPTWALPNAVGPQNADLPTGSSYMGTQTARPTTFKNPNVATDGPIQPSGQPTPANPRGSSIPFAGVYLEQQNAAQTAYEKAQQQLLANRNTLYHKYGLSSEGKVDPYNSYGTYQQLLSSEGDDLDQARNNAVGRGIGTGGLARQDESRLRFQQAGQNLDFQALVDQAGNDYTSGMAQALNTKNDAFYGAERDALAQALAQMSQDGYWTPVGPGGGDSGNGGSVSAPTSSPALINNPAISALLPKKPTQKQLKGVLLQ